MNTLLSEDFSRLLPHAPPMLMLSQVLELGAEHNHCLSIIQADNPLLRDGLFPVASALEPLAQAAGLLLAEDVVEPAQPGAIVQVKTFTAHAACIPVGAELHIHARKLGGNSSAALVAGEVYFQQQEIYQASLMIALLPEERP